MRFFYLSRMSKKEKDKEVTPAPIERRETEGNDERCGTCRFFSPGQYDGICKRRAPQVMSGTLHDYTAWPKVSSYDWCGDYEAKELLASKRAEG